MKNLCDFIIDRLAPARIIGITGSGGKTQSLIELASAFKARGKSVLMSTTTKLESPTCRDFKADKYFYDKSIFDYKPKKGEKVLFGYKEWKIISPPVTELKELTAIYDVVIFEADGARNLPLKIHSDRDPVIPAFTEGIISVVGFFPYKEKVTEKNCFGAINYKGIVDADFYNYYLRLEQGPEKKLIENSVVLFNEADIMKRDELEKVKNTVKSNYDIIYGSMLENKKY